MIAHKTASHTDALTSIRLFAQLSARQGKLEQALQALAFVAQHVAATARVKNSAQHLFDDLAPAVAPAVVTQAKDWAAMQTLAGGLAWVETLMGSAYKVKFLDRVTR